MFLKLNILVASFGLDWRANISFFSTVLGVNALLFPYKQEFFTIRFFFYFFAEMGFCGVSRVYDPRIDQSKTRKKRKKI